MKARIMRKFNDEARSEKPQTEVELELPFKVQCKKMRCPASFF